MKHAKFQVKSGNKRKSKITIVANFYGDQSDHSYYWSSKHQSKTTRSDIFQCYAMLFFELITIN